MASKSKMARLAEMVRMATKSQKAQDCRDSRLPRFEIAKTAKFAEIAKIAETEIVRFLETFKICNRKKLDFYSKSLKRGKFAVECVSNGFISQKCLPPYL